MYIITSNVSNLTSSTSNVMHVRISDLSAWIWWS